MYCVDTSVWVNSFDQRETGHTISRQVLHALAAQSIPLFVPYLVLVEVASAISRTRQDAAQAVAFLRNGIVYLWNNDDYALRS